MAICPADGCQCWNDLCYGSGCMRMEGYDMLERCDVCGGLVDHMNPDLGTCTCDDEDYYE